MQTRDILTFLKQQAELTARLIDWEDELNNDQDDFDPSFSLKSLSQILTELHSAENTLLHEYMRLSVVAARKLVAEGAYKRALAIVLRVIAIDPDYNEATKLQRQILNRIIQDMVSHCTPEGVQLAENYLREITFEIEPVQKDMLTELIARAKGFQRYLGSIRRELREHPESDMYALREVVIYPLNSPLTDEENLYLEQLVEGQREYFRSLQQALADMRARSLGTEENLEDEMTVIFTQLSLEYEDTEWMEEQKDAFITRREDVDENLLDDIEARYGLDEEDEDLDVDVQALLEAYGDLADDESAYVRAQIGEFARAREQMKTLRDVIYHASLDLGCNVEALARIVDEADLAPRNERAMREYVSERENRAVDLQQVRDDLEAIFMKLDEVDQGAKEDIMESLGDVDDGEQQVFRALFDRLEARRSLVVGVRNRVKQAVASSTDVRALCAQLGTEYTLTPGEAKGLFAYATTCQAIEVQLDHWRTRLAEVVFSFVLPETEVGSQADEVMEDIIQELSTEEIQTLEAYRQTLVEQRATHLQGLKALIDERWAGISTHRIPDIRKIIKKSQKSGVPERMQDSATFYLDFQLKPRKDNS